MIILLTDGRNNAGALSPRKAAEIAKRALAENRPILEVAVEMTDLDESRLRQLLDPARLTGNKPENSE